MHLHRAGQPAAEPQRLRMPHWREHGGERDVLLPAAAGVYARGGVGMGGARASALRTVDRHRVGVQLEAHTHDQLLGRAADQRYGDTADNIEGAAAGWGRRKPSYNGCAS